MAATLSFTVRTSPNVKTAHLLGSWDNYSGQLPLSKDPSKAGAWRGTFRFSSSTLPPGQRYWYYVSTSTSSLYLPPKSKSISVHHGWLPRLPQPSRTINQRANHWSPTQYSRCFSRSFVNFRLQQARRPSINGDPQRPFPLAQQDSSP